LLIIWIYNVIEKDFKHAKISQEITMMKTLLAIGDEEDFDSFQKFLGQSRLLKKRGFDFKKIDYQAVLEGKLPKIKTKKVMVLFFFPFIYWEENIETKKSKKVYGNRDYFIKFRKFWKEVSKNLKKYYKDKDLHFINLPEKLHVERDKELTRKILSKAGIPVPKHYFTRDYKKILEMINAGRKLFIKVRYGSMGKGITYLEKDYWLTNFRFRKNRIISKKSDYGWTFINISDNKKFLKKLLKQDIVIEEAVNPFLMKGRKFDLRVYVAFGKVLYVYPRTNEYDKIITNISQGARGEDKRFLNSLPPRLVGETKKNALKAVEAMDLNFAGVDIMPDGDHSVVVIEVNGFPGFPSMKDKKVKFNLSKYLIGEMAKEKWA
jgi:glutathione synthase/RimK-type ligase-like ATP-grasp enzyme